MNKKNRNLGALELSNDQLAKVIGGVKMDDDGRTCTDPRGTKPQGGGTFNPFSQILGN
jgi:bacteriocin-like protein